MEQQRTIHVSLFGGFSMKCIVDGVEYSLTEKYSTSKRLWAFLQYMTVFHHRDISQEEMIEALWWDEESANPGNALKTTLCRARTALEELGFPDGKPIILYKRGLYRWSEDVRLVLDVEEFDTLFPNHELINLEEAVKAAALYRGDFLPNAEAPWVISIRTYYHAKFVSLCGKTAAMLNAQERYDEAISICRSGIDIDPFDEPCHLELMMAMASSGLTQPALQHYNYITNLFMDQLGVSPSKEMTDLYRRLTHANESMEMDLKVVRGLLTEPKGNGAFYCDYGIFQEMYRLEARRAVRTGVIVQLAMITVLDTNGECLQSRRCSASMEEMRSVLHHSLRAGDIFARFSAAQYLLLLPTASYENGIKVLRRIQNNYGRTLIGMTTSMEYSILPVLPANEEEALFCSE